VRFTPFCSARSSSQPRSSPAPTNTQLTSGLSVRSRQRRNQRGPCPCIAPAASDPRSELRVRRKIRRSAGCEPGLINPSNCGSSASRQNAVSALRTSCSAATCPLCLCSVRDQVRMLQRPARNTPAAPRRPLHARRQCSSSAEPPFASPAHSPRLGCAASTMMLCAVPLAPPSP